MELAETHAFYVFNTGEAFARIVMSNGARTAVLRGRSYLVKGVAWDLIGSLIVSQTDNETVVIKAMVHSFHS